MRVILSLSMLLAFFAVAPAWAAQKPAYRRACTDDAYKFCKADIPDAIAVEKCLRANVGGLGRACRAQFIAPAKKMKPRARHR